MACPPVGWIKINFDGSIQNLQGTTGFVIRNSDGHVLLASANKIGETTINVAECLTLRDGLALALNRRWRKIIVEGDSNLIIDSVLKKVLIPWSIQQIVQDILPMSSYSIHFQHVLGRPISLQIL
ncbi:hypothetical protein ACE6H2_020715 [Prunus campanulata]